MSAGHDSCCTATLAQSSVGSVMRCAACGVVHLQLQYLTLRFDDESFRELSQLLGQAQRRVEHMQEPAAPVRAALHGVH